MKKIVKVLLVLALVASFMPQAFASSYGERMMERKYIKAINSGCEDIIVKNPKTALFLGLLPGFGSFYVGETGLGVADLLLWPISPIWDMPLSNKKAHQLNKEETIMICEEEGKI